MPSTIQYKDYFSLKTLYKYSVNPEQNINLSDSKNDILKVFGNISNEDKKFLSGKIDAMYLDNGIKVEAERERIEITELDDELGERVFSNEDDKTKSLEIEDLRI